MSATDWLVFARCAGLVARAPGFSHPSVPPPIRMGFALALALLVAPRVAQARLSDPGAFVSALATEALLGAAIGFGASQLYDAAYHAGRTIDDYVGVRGSVPNANVTSAQEFGRLWSSTFLAGFFLLDGWVPIVRTFAASFDAVPAGGLVAAGGWSAYALALPRAVVGGALLVAAPALAVGVCVQVALAAVGRVVPRLAGFSLSFPLVFAAVLIVTLAGVVLLAPLAAHPWLLAPYAR